MPLKYQMNSSNIYGWKSPPDYNGLRNNPVDSNKYQQHVFLGVNHEKGSLLLHFILLHVGILYSGKFFFNGKSLGTKICRYKEVLCIKKLCFCSG